MQSIHWYVFPDKVYYLQLPVSDDDDVCGDDDHDDDGGGLRGAHGGAGDDDDDDDDHPDLPTLSPPSDHLVVEIRYDLETQRAPGGEDDTLDVETLKSQSTHVYFPFHLG